MTQTVRIMTKAYNKYQVPQVDNRTRGGYKMLTALRSLYGETVLDGVEVKADGREIEIWVNTYDLTWGRADQYNVEAMRAEVAAKVARVNANA